MSLYSRYIPQVASATSGQRLQVCIESLRTRDPREPFEKGQDEALQLIPTVASVRDSRHWRQTPGSLEESRKLLSAFKSVYGLMDERTTCHAMMLSDYHFSPGKHQHSHAAKRCIQMDTMRGTLGAWRSVDLLIGNGAAQAPGPPSADEQWHPRP